MQHLRFPIGPFKIPESVEDADIFTMIGVITSFPMDIISLTQGLKESDLIKTYRPGGWSVRQLVHHCADSHMNAFIRFKLTMTEDQPTIKPYEEAQWAELDDTTKMPIQDSLDIIRAVHARWTVLLISMKNSDFERCYVHPEYGLLFRLDQALANYDWHCRHHLAHIRLALDQK